ncbi:hypothetical protein PV325_009929 [Microctonus aethiopoides]|uniref:Uncharacterized protein n=1 Tax=Microctonus aethiopoides TaxID=144406 RepID=A0AA39F6L5_9HYME|nr:hypothetical protein PV326_013682 [Microctonus aethiopoides]KAK0073314.1 hypothetical protein PV325_009929 [Microctonus aethiopoides]KAK0163907.1 hypothetical protein PV328_002592 [Microctonus aethiopoides]
MKVYLLIGVIAMIFVTGETLKCYKKELSEEVIDVSKAKTKNCTLNMCFKGEIQYFNGSIQTMHDCFPTTPSMISQSKKNELYQRTDNIDILSSGGYLCNNTDLCNHAQSVSSSVLILLFTSVPLFITLRNFN